MRIAPLVLEKGRLLVPWAFTIHALVVRETRSRFSGDPIGYGWAIVTPLMWVISIAFVFNFIGRTVPIDTDIVSFLLAGLLPYTVFRTTITSTMRSVRTNRHMLYFASISKVDILIASALLELINAFSVYAVLALGNYLFYGNFELYDPVWALTGFALAWSLGVSFGHMAMAFLEISDAALRVVPIVLRPMFWISGIFYVANELPGYLVAVLKYNPLLQAVEIMRTGAFLGYTSRYVDILIPLSFIVGMNVVAVIAKVYANNNLPQITRRTV